MAKFFDVKNASYFEFNYRWVQPPQAAYFISTIDEMGNTNLTPVTLGTLNCAYYPTDGKKGSYYFSFALSTKKYVEEGNKHDVRHGFYNLQKNGECVISYIGESLLNESIICNMPIPYGISEFDVAGLTPFDSTMVKPKSIKECPVNMECRVVHSHSLDGVYQLYVCEIVGVSVDEKHLQIDANDERHLGILNIDPLFEVQIIRDNSGSTRLNYAKIDKGSIKSTGENFGCLVDWVGTFEQWIDDECLRNKITQTQKNRIIELKHLWEACKDPVKNKAVKDELSEFLYKICKSVDQI